MLGFSAFIGADSSRIYRAVHLIAGNVVAPLALVSLASGIVLTRLKLAITPDPDRRGRDGAGSAAGDGGCDGPGTASIRDLNVALAVYKPGWRVRRNRGQSTAMPVSQPEEAY